MTGSMEAATPPTKCTHCHQPMRSPVFCQNCRVINPVPPDTDYFTIFGLPRRYQLDEKELHKRFLNLTRDVHPDRFATSAPETINVTMRLAAQVNEAHEVLKDPVLRAEYLLQQAGGKRPSEEKGAPGGMLAEVMELREQIEEAVSRDDRTALEELRRRVNDMHAEVQETVASLAEAVADQPEAEDLQELRAYLNGIKYVRNLQDLLSDKV
ncbi:MAG: Fe-S protein assembly co-chaperone HscB [Phycisphaerales bacterium]|nr:MAG: Fe-S protein assembly co-chaperone HscB [Phycisphaerales bacterium]